MKERFRNLKTLTSAAMIGLAISLLPGLTEEAKAQKDHSAGEFPISGTATYMNTGPTMATIDARLRGVTASNLDTSCLEGVDGYVALYNDHINRRVWIADKETGEVLGEYCVTDVGAVHDRPYLDKIGFAADIWPPEDWHRLSAGKQVVVYNSRPGEATSASRGHESDFSPPQKDQQVTPFSTGHEFPGETNNVDDSNSTGSQAAQEDNPVFRSSEKTPPIDIQRDQYNPVIVDGVLHNPGTDTIVWQKDNNDGTFIYHEEPNPVPEDADFKFVD